MPRFALVHLDYTELNTSPERTFGLTAALGDLDAARDAVASGYYTVQCIVEAQDTEDLFRRTNSKDEPWTKTHPPELGGLLQRSTSCGDFAVNLDTGDASFCAPHGWRQVTGALSEILLERARKFEAKDHAIRPPA